MPKIARVAYWIAFIAAGFAVIAAVRGPIIVLLGAVVPLIAGLGIMRRRVWSAYGFALYQFAGLLVIPLVLARNQGTATERASIVVGAVLVAALVALFFFAGRALAASGAERGRAFPWIALSAIATLPVLFVQAFVNPTGSMEKTLLVGDRILVRRFPRPTPVRGDIVVFAYPVDRRQTFTKRVVGVAGDRIRMSQKTLYRNGAAVTEPWVIHTMDYIDSYRDNFPSGEPYPGIPNQALDMLQKHVVNGEVVVPEGKYFVMGDNRDQSLDSRYWGFVSDDEIIGEPILIYDSAEQSTEDAVNGITATRKRTRWERLFKRL